MAHIILCSLLIGFLRSRIQNLKCCFVGKFSFSAKMKKVYSFDKWIDIRYWMIETKVAIMIEVPWSNSGIVNTTEKKKRKGLKRVKKKVSCNLYWSSKIERNVCVHAFFFSFSSSLNKHSPISLAGIFFRRFKDELYPFFWIEVSFLYITSGEKIKISVHLNCYWCTQIIKDSEEFKNYASTIFKD